MDVRNPLQHFVFITAMGVAAAAAFNACNMPEANVEEQPGVMQKATAEQRVLADRMHTLRADLAAMERDTRGKKLDARSREKLAQRIEAAQFKLDQIRELSKSVDQPDGTWAQLQRDLRDTIDQLTQRVENLDDEPG